MKYLLFLTSFPLSLIILNLYYRYKTFRSVDQEIKKLNWLDLPHHEYVNRSYHFVADRFSKVSRCWLKYPWRNMYFTNMWKLKGFGLPCHMQNILFQRFLMKKMKSKHIRTLAAWSLKKGMIIHFYSRIKMKDRWIDVDVWGKKWGIPFGKSIHNSELVH